MKVMKKLVLAAVAAAVVAALVLAACGTGGGGAPAAGAGELPSLSAIWGPYFPMGNIVSTVDYGWRPARVADIGNPRLEHILRRHFSGFITAEDEMKPDALNSHTHQTQQWRWDRANTIMNFAENNGFRVHGHVLAWHSQSPWILNLASAPPSGWRYIEPTPPPRPRQEAINNLVNHIEIVMRHFGPRMDSWEVLNEIFPSGGIGGGVAAGNWRGSLRNTPWNRAIPLDPATGNCHIWYAFTTARRVADEIDVAAGRPVGTMLLYYNDYNEDNAGKRNAIYFMVREMNERFARENNGRILIDVIGMQSHYHVGGAGAAWTHGVNVNNVRQTIQRFSTLIDEGLLRYISVTELDVTVGNTDISPLTPQQERMQATMYAQLFQIYRDHADVLRRVSVWGIHDPASWRARGNPLLFNGDLTPKEAFWAVANPDAFLADPDAFLANPRAFIDARYWQ